MYVVSRNSRIISAYSQKMTKKYIMKIKGQKYYQKLEN